MDMTKWVTALASVEGIDGIGLGGSKNWDESDSHSDAHISIYYQDTIDWQELETCLTRLMEATRCEKVLYLPGEWGPLVNGGAWLTVDGEAVDILLRDTNRTQAVIEDCLKGNITLDYQVGHPFGFVNTIYAAEIHYVKILWESDHQPITKLKELLHKDGAYPTKMKANTITYFLFNAESTMCMSKTPAKHGDSHYALGKFFQAVGSWNQVLFALNERYLMNEKSSIKLANELPIRPQTYLVRVNQMYEYLARQHVALAFEEFELLHKEITNLVKEYDNY